MHTISVRALARRTAVAATLAAMSATPLVAPTPATARAAHVGDGAQAPSDLGRPQAHPAAVERRTERREAERRARLRAEREAAEAAASSGERILSLAAHEAGDPYVYGAAGPSAFDCSGFTQYVFAQVGVSLPHSSSAQAAMATPVSDPQPGDLVFFASGGGVYHVGIYAGNGMLWHAPRPGDDVSLDPIWTSGVFYGRV